MPNIDSCSRRRRKKEKENQRVHRAGRGMRTEESKGQLGEEEWGECLMWSKGDGEM